MKLFVLIKKGSDFGEFQACILAETIKEAKEIFRQTYNEKYSCNVSKKDWKVKTSFPDSDNCNIMYDE